MNREGALKVMKILRFGKFEEIINTQEIVNEALEMAIEALKEQRTHSEWIPCSERLPEKEQKIYLVTIDYGDGLSCVAPRFFWDEKRLWNEAEEYITAWMPMPEPYKEGGDENEHDK